jgi:DNA polymerase-1
LRIICDIETNALEGPTEIWLIVCKDIDTGQYYIFKDILHDEDVRNAFRRVWNSVTTVVGHNWLGYDWPVLSSLVPNLVQPQQSLDTLVLSKLVDYSRQGGHSLEQYGLEFNLPKLDCKDFSHFTPLMETYCIRDVDITEKVYHKYIKVIDDPLWQPSITLEHNFQLIVNDLHNNGFAFNSEKAIKLLDQVTTSLSSIDKEIADAFPERLQLIREIHPKLTKHGTLSRTDFRWVTDGDLSIYNGGPFSRCEWVAFNPSSHKQIIQVLNNAGWKPVNKTKTHIDLERELKRLDRQRQRDKSFDLAFKEVYARLQLVKVSGWKVDEDNLATLPPTSPPPARLLAKRILLEARRRTLTEWLSLVGTDGRIHGRFFGIGAWTHRMAHQNPNTANIPNQFDTQGKEKLLGKDMRSLWIAPRNRLLVGVDAEGIQLRIFAHYINDPEFTKSLIEGKKDDKTDPHSLNQRILGSACKSRAAAKRFIYALLLGAGIGKLAEILDTSKSETEAALDRLLLRYTGFAELKQTVIPKDASRGYFVGLDGRKVRIPGNEEGSKRHLAMSGYLQGGEALVMKRATVLFYPELQKLGGKLVNFVHDEWQTECKNDLGVGLTIAKLQADALRQVGEDLKLNCPLAGSYWNDDHHEYTIGNNWSVTH